MGDFVSLPRRDFDKMDQGDRMNWALAGWIRVASRALAEGLAPGPRGWVSNYPRDLIKDLDHWIDALRELDGEDVSYADQS